MQDFHYMNRIDTTPNKMQKISILNHSVDKLQTKKHSDLNKKKNNFNDDFILVKDNSKFFNNEKFKAPIKNFQFKNTSSYYNKINPKNMNGFETQRNVFSNMNNESNSLFIDKMPDKVLHAEILEDKVNLVFLEPKILF